MEKLIQDIRNLLVSPDYEKAFILWLEELSNKPEFLQESFPVEAEPVLVQMLEMLGKKLFKQEKPHIEKLMLREFKPKRIIHGFVFLEKRLVVILYFPDMGMGVSTIHLEPKQVIYTRLTQLEEPLTGGVFMQNPDKSLN